MHVDSKVDRPCRVFIFHGRCLEHREDLRFSPVSFRKMAFTSKGTKYTEDLCLDPWRTIFDEESDIMRFRKRIELAVYRSRVTLFAAVNMGQEAFKGKGIAAYIRVP